MTHLSTEQFAKVTSSAEQAEAHSVVTGCHYVITEVALEPTPELYFQPNCVVIGIGKSGLDLHHPHLAPYDVIVPESQGLTSLTTAIDNHPWAAATLVQILRHNANASILDGLLAESLAYSTLLCSEEFQNWLHRYRTSDTAENRPAEADVLLLERTSVEGLDTLNLVFNRPALHNAYNAALKDALCAGLDLALTDPEIQQIHLSGAGASFCSGGDLDEFGSVSNPATGHISRTTRSAGALLARLRDKTHVSLHGACIGAGIELPAFAASISAHPQSFFQLPEVAMGLIPGAGGTVSVLRRIGRHRTAWLALTNERIDADTALEWGLIDAVSDVSRPD